MTIEKAAESIGRAVRYVHPSGRWSEDGIITSVNAHWVFVRYGTDQNSKATAPASLELGAP